MFANRSIGENAGSAQRADLLPSNRLLKLSNRRNMRNYKSVAGLPDYQQLHGHLSARLCNGRSNCFRTVQAAARHKHPQASAARR
jgi:hypothetical protein